MKQGVLEVDVVKNLNEGWFFRQVGTSEWMSATVPGCNHTDLLDHQKIEDPFWRLNEADLQWIDKEDWEYRSAFQIDFDPLGYDRVKMRFAGLDTYAEVRVNGELVLTADNMFREWVVDVKKELRHGANELHILFRSPIVEGVKAYDALDYVVPAQFTDMAEHGQVEGAKRVSVHTRKPGYHYGWDWGPRLVSSGIWRPITLEAWNEVRIENLKIVQNEVESDRACLTAVFEVESKCATSASLGILLGSEMVGFQKVMLRPGLHAYEVPFHIDFPKLWWCNGLGDAHLYSLTAKLLLKERVITCTERVGIRTIELVQEKDDVGSSFYFKLNGVPVFMKGANYIPNDIYQTRVSDEKYRKVIETARDSNFNMLRVWGGGFYENDLFYELCDEAGILVWQDFMFACAMFPGHEAFVENVRQEAVDNVRRLRNHPCLALWCGNNEIVVAWERWGWKERELEIVEEHATRIWRDYEHLFHEVLAQVVDEHDPARSYWSSSPTVEPGVPSSLTSGDEHYWGVWHQKQPYETYSTHIGRFMSEYGFQSFPELRTVKEYALPEDFGLLTDVMKAHQRSPVGNEAIEHYMLQSYRQPRDFEEFLYVGQVLQAELIKYAVEAHRRAMPYCMGTLYWQLNDCWPVASWSSMDSSLRWKALQYFVKKSYASLILSTFVQDGCLSVHVVNDHLQDIDAAMKVRVMDFYGDDLTTQMLPVTVPQNSSSVHFEMDVSRLLGGADEKKSLLVSELIKGGKVLARSIFYFAKVKELELPPASVDYTIAATSEGFELQLTCECLAKNVYLTIGDEDGFFSDNYFDLLPDESFSVRLKTGMDRETLEHVLGIRTLV